jgi:hypothetical protein
MMNFCWNWKWNEVQKMFEFEKKNRLWYSSKSSKSKNESEDWIIICDEEIYAKFVIWDEKKRNKQRKTCVKIIHEIEKIIKDE